MRLTLIVAMAENRVIGRGGKLPWHVSEDLKRFKRLTMGRPILMGRKTWDSLGRPLPGRENVVVTRQRGLRLPGATVVHSLDEALARARSLGADEAFVIGGAELISEALPLADRLELTLIHHPFEGDVLLPPLGDGWTEVAREERSQPAEGDQPALRFDFVTLERAGSGKR